VPDEVALRCGLVAGLELDRTLARSLARELRKSKAVRIAVRALRARPLSEQQLQQRLRERGVLAADGRFALDALCAAGFVDDVRVAQGRAQALAERGWGDEAILERLRGEGLRDEHVLAALGELEPEAERAERSVQGREPPKAWALLRRRGFRPDTVEAVLGALDADGPDGLG
jgi:regulatory protein